MIEHYLRKRFPGTGDPYPGKKLYMQMCGKCHTLHAVGGKIGPDLTTYKRDNVRQMLVHIVNPSAEIREGFETYVAVLKDGRVVTGFDRREGFVQTVTLRQSRWTNDFAGTERPGRTEQVAQVADAGRATEGTFRRTVAQSVRLSAQLTAIK